MNSQLYAEFVVLSRNMQSLVARLESRELGTCKDISDLRGHIVSQLSRIDISLDAISRSVVVLHDKIETTAAKMENLMSMVSSQKIEHHHQGKILHVSSQETPPMEEEVLEDSQNPTQEHTTSPDITCLETIGPCKHQLQDPELLWTGCTDCQEWANLEELMSDFQTPI